MDKGEQTPISHLFTADFLNKFLEIVVGSELRIVLKEDDIYEIVNIRKKLESEDKHMDDFLDSYSDSVSIDKDGKSILIANESPVGYAHEPLTEKLLANSKGIPLEVFIDIIYIEVGQSKMCAKYFKTIDVNVLRAWTKSQKVIDTEQPLSNSYIGPPSPIRQIPTPVLVGSAEYISTLPSPQKDSNRLFTSTFWNRAADTPVSNIFGLFNREKGTKIANAGNNGNQNPNTGNNDGHQINALQGNPFVFTGKELNAIKSPTCVSRDISQINIIELKYVLHQLYNWASILLVFGVKGNRTSWVNSQMEALPLEYQKVIFKWCLLEHNYGTEEFSSCNGWSRVLDDIKLEGYAIKLNVENESADIFKEGGFLSISSSKNPESSNLEPEQIFCTVRSKADTLNIDEFKEELRIQFEKEKGREIASEKEELAVKIRNEIERELYEQQKKTQAEVEKETRQGIKENLTREVTQRVENEFKEKLEVIKKSNEKNDELKKLAHQKVADLEKLQQENEMLRQSIQEKEEAKLIELPENLQETFINTSDTNTKLIEENAILLQENYNLVKLSKENDQKMEVVVSNLTKTSDLKVSTLLNKLKEEKEVLARENEELKVTIKEANLKPEQKTEKVKNTEELTSITLARKNEILLKEADSLKKLIDDLKTSSSKSTEVSDIEVKLKNEISKLAKENMRLSTVIKSQDEDLNNSKKSIDEIDAITKSNKEKYLKLKNRSKDMEDALTVKTDDLNCVSKENNELKYELTKNLQLIKELKKSSLEKDSQLMNLSNRTEEISMKLELYDSSMEQMVKFQRENKEMDDFVISIKKEIGKILTHLEVAETVETPEEICKCILEKVGQIITERNVLKGEIENFKNKVKGFEDDKVNAVNEINQKMIEQHIAIEKIGNAMKISADKYYMASDLLESIEKVIDAILDALNMSNTEKLKLSKQSGIIEKLHDIKGKYEGIIIKLKSLVEFKRRAETELKSNQDSINEFEEREKRLHSTIDELTKQKVEMELEINELKVNNKSNSGKKEEIQNLTLRLDECNKLKEGLELKLKTLDSEYGKLKIDYESREKMINHLSEAIKSSENEAKVFNETSKSLEAVVEKMTNEVSSVNEQLIQVQNARGDLEMEKNKLKVEILKHQEQMNKLNEELKSNGASGAKLEELVKRYDLIDNERRKYQDQLNKSQKQVQKLIGFKDEIEMERNVSRQLKNQLQEFQYGFDKMKEDDDMIIEGLHSQLRSIKKAQLENKGKGDIIGGYLEGKVMVEVLRQLQSG